MATAPNGKEIDQSLIDTLVTNYPDQYPNEQAAVDWIVANDSTYSTNTTNTNTGENFTAASPSITDEELKKNSGKITPQDLENFQKLKEEITDESLIQKTLRAHGIFSPNDMDYNTSFYPMHRNDPFNRVDATREIVFFTKPYLPILNRGGTLNDEFASTPYFVNLWRRGYTQTFADLSFQNGPTGTDGNCPFIHILTNRITASIDVPDIAVDELETAQNMWGTRILYPKSSMSSDENLDFTCEFEDTKYLEIYHLFKAWDLYRQGKWWGIFSPDQTYVTNKILYDQIAVYKFTIASDGETLLHWCKWTGCFPKSISRSSFTEIPKEGPLKITVNFKLSGWFEDMEPNILSDFNQIVADWAGTGLSSNIYDIWSDDIGMVSQDNVQYPFILEGKPDSKGKVPYYFEWARNN